MLTGGAEDVTGVGSALEYMAYGFFCLCRTHTAWSNGRSGIRACFSRREGSGWKTYHPFLLLSLTLGQSDGQLKLLLLLQRCFVSLRGHLVGDQDKSQTPVIRILKKERINLCSWWTSSCIYVTHFNWTIVKLTQCLEFIYKVFPGYFKFPYARGYPSINLSGVINYI